MKIGEDYPKLEWRFMEMDLLEPNAFMGDIVLAAIALVLFYKTRKLHRENTTLFNLMWSYFFLIFGIGFFLGGLGHLFYNFMGVYGKFSSWYLGILSTLCIELAMISQLNKWKATLEKISILKATLSFLALTVIILFMDISNFPLRGLIVPTLNSFIGLFFALGFLGYRFSKTKSKSFRYLYYSVIVLIPSVAFQGLKINFHPWLDRNDVSHILLAISLLLYYKAIKHVQQVVS